MTEKVVDGIEQMNQKMGEGEKKASALSKALKFAKSAYKAGAIVVKATIAPAAQEQKLEDLFKVKIQAMQKWELRCFRLLRIMR